MTKYQYKIGRSMPPPVDLLDSSDACSLTILLANLFKANCECYEYETKRLIYKQKKPEKRLKINSKKI